MTMTFDLTAFEQELPAVPQNLANYVTAVRTGNLLYTAGILPIEDGQIAYTGRLETEEDVAKGLQAARLACLNGLSVVAQALGGLKNVKRVVKLNGFVSSAPEFYEQPAVLNGASDLLVDVFGDKGKHARAAVGVAALPKNATVEIELVIEVA